MIGKAYEWGAELHEIDQNVRLGKVVCQNN